MLRQFSHLKNFALAGTDGEIGRIKELYFDDGRITSARRRIFLIPNQKRHMQKNTYFNLKQLIHIAAVAIVSVTAALMLTGQRVVPREQYLVLNVTLGQNPAAFQAELNDLGNQGWKVRSSVGNWIVLAGER